MQVLSFPFVSHCFSTCWTLNCRPQLRPPSAALCVSSQSNSFQGPLACETGLRGEACSCGSLLNTLKTFKNHWKRHLPSSVHGHRHGLDRSAPLRPGAPVLQPALRLPRGQEELLGRHRGVLAQVVVLPRHRPGLPVDAQRLRQTSERTPRRPHPRPPGGLARSVARPSSGPAAPGGPVAPAASAVACGRPAAGRWAAAPAAPAARSALGRPPGPRPPGSKAAAPATIGTRHGWGQIHTPTRRRKPIWDQKRLERGCLPRPPGSAHPPPPPGAPQASSGRPPPASWRPTPPSCRGPRPPPAAADAPRTPSSVKIWPKNVQNKSKNQWQAPFRHLFMHRSSIRWSLQHLFDTWRPAWKLATRPACRASRRRKASQVSRFCRAMARIGAVATVQAQVCFKIHIT